MYLLDKSIRFYSNFKLNAESCVVFLIELFKGEKFKSSLFAETTDHDFQAF